MHFVIKKNEASRRLGQQRASLEVLRSQVEVRIWAWTMARLPTVMMIMIIL